MKDCIRILAGGITVAGLMAVSMFLPQKQNKNASVLSPEEISWVEFCRQNGYDPHEETEEMLIEFNDTWRGSTAEEEALRKNGIESWG